MSPHHAVLLRAAVVTKLEDLLVCEPVAHERLLARAVTCSVEWRGCSVRTTMQPLKRTHKSSSPSSRRQTLGSKGRRLVTSIER